jgi:hypothetical protein
MSSRRNCYICRHCTRPDCIGCVGNDRFIPDAEYDEKHGESCESVKPHDDETD